MKVKDFIRSCRKDGVRAYNFKNGILLMTGTGKFFSVPTYDAIKYAKSKKFKQFLRKLWRHK